MPNIHNQYPVKEPLEESDFIASERSDELENTSDEKDRRPRGDSPPLDKDDLAEPQSALSRSSTLGNEVARVMPEKITRPGFHLMFVIVNYRRKSP